MRAPDRDLMFIPVETVKKSSDEIRTFLKLKF
jgi:hypothetical protein